MISKERIKAYALKNALEHDGKAKEGAVLNSLFQEGLRKEDISKIMPVIKEIVKEVNALANDKKIREFDELKKGVKERKVRQGLPELPNAIKGKVITRLAPEPSKYAHVGHALTFLLNYIYAEKYDGKCLLRFEDANPEKVTQEYADEMLKDIKDYLGIKLSAIRYVSDDMPILYVYAEKLINFGKAYLCFCTHEKMQQLRHEGKECECRESKKEENINIWVPFIKGKYEQGKATLRFKGNMQALNHVMRDPVLFRIIKARHYRHEKKYKAWPVFDFYNPIEDNLMKVTHILRSNEFNDRVELQDAIKDLLGLSRQTIIQYGRFNVIDAITQGREMRKIVESDGIGWDDPRLMTLKSLKRRGIKKEVLYALTKNIGLSPHEVNLDFGMVAAISRKLLDKEAKRYFFVPEPVEIIIDGMPKINEIVVPVHPEKKQKRKVKIGKRFFISNLDCERLKGKEIRLLHLCNVLLSPLANGKARAVFTSRENKEIPRIQWVSNYVDADIIMPDAVVKKGFAEEAVLKLKQDSVIQFERFGFCRLDKKLKNKAEFWFSHE